MNGFRALFLKEVRRFFKVSLQTIAAPVLTSLLYLLIFAHVVGGMGGVGGMGENPNAAVGSGGANLSYSAFLVPGLVIMSILQNAFANPSSSLIQAKGTGSIVFVLLAPISPLTFFAAYVLAAVVRGIAVGLCCLIASLALVIPTIMHPITALVFAMLGAALLGVLGLLAGIWAEKYEQMAAFQNFIILPLTMLSGIFYSIQSLPPLWQAISRFNPFFYMIDGFRYGFFGVADFSPLTSLAVTLGCLAGLSALVLFLLQRGWKLRY